MVCPVQRFFFSGFWFWSNSLLNCCMPTLFWTFLCQRALRTWALFKVRRHVYITQDWHYIRSAPFTKMLAVVKLPKLLRAFVLVLFAKGWEWGEGLGAGGEERAVCFVHKFFFLVHKRNIKFFQTSPSFTGIFFAAFKPMCRGKRPFSY